MSLKIHTHTRTHTHLNESEIKAVCGETFHQTRLPGSTLSCMLFILPLCALWVLCLLHADTHTQMQDHYRLWIKLLPGCGPAVHSVSCGWVFVCCTVPLFFDAFIMLTEAGECTVVNQNRGDNLSATCCQRSARTGPQVQGTIAGPSGAWHWDHGQRSGWKTNRKK